MQPFFVHPVLVHFPVALFVFEFFLTLVWLSKRSELYRKFAWVTFRFAYVSTVVAMAGGLYDAGGLTDTVKPHAIAAVVTFILFTVRAVLWLKMGRTVTVPGKLWLSLAASGVLLIALAGHLGAQMVYTI